MPSFIIRGTTVTETIFCYDTITLHFSRVHYWFISITKRALSLASSKPLEALQAAVLMRYRKMHAIARAIDLNATESLARRDQGFGGAVSDSEVRGLGGGKETGDGHRRFDDGGSRLDVAPGRGEKFREEERCDHGDAESVDEDKVMKVELAGSLNAMDVRFQDTTITGILENRHMKVDTPLQISNNGMACGTECSPKGPQDGKNEESDVNLIVDDNGFSIDEEIGVRFASDVDNGEDSVMQKATTLVKPEPLLGVSDLVWGKVRSHPWWPGQIFDPSAASVKAKKCFKKGRYLVAYFGDQTFAWNDEASIKPFEENFSRMEKQNNSYSFSRAVDCALDELYRRVEYGLACNCLSEEVYDKISTQRVINAGIKEESITRDGKDRFLNAGSFKPARLVEYVKRVAESPLTEGDRLEFVVQRAHLLAFARWRGYHKLPEFEVIDGSMENGEDNNIATGKRRGKGGDLGKLKSKPFSGEQSSKKEKSLSGLMANKQLPNSKKRKARSSVLDDSAIRDGRRQSRGSDGKSPQVEQKFKVGEKIRKVACEMRGFSRTSYISQSLGTMKLIIEQNSPDEMMAHLCSVARNPTNQFNALTPKLSFFSQFRDFVVEQHQGADDETVKASTGETLDSECIRDSYWTDRIIEREDQTSSVRGSENEMGDDNPTALILNFANVDSIPSEKHLNNIFHRFGRLNESETKIFKRTKRAKVVFKRRENAETAFSSAGKYSIFGPSLLSYSLKYEPSKSA